MGVKLLSTSGGSVEVNPPATASNFTQTLVPITGTLAPLVSGTAVASTSGTSIDFTGIPSWVKRITVMLNGVSTNGTSAIQIQLGAGSVETSGYASTSAYSQAGNAAGALTSTAGLLVNTGGSATNTHTGHMVITNISGNIWIESNAVGTNTTLAFFGGGSKTTSSTLDRIRITTANGTDTFDAGSINILYE
jgi:hypothetical protein